jgi:glycosyltransferase involved in cell wall biosynthesis
VAHWSIPCAWPAFDPTCRGELEVVSHGSDVRLIERLPGPVRARLVATIAARATEWRFVSASLQQALVEAAPASAARLRDIARVAPSPFELPDVHDAATERRLEIGRPFVSSVGRLVAFKHVDRIVETAARERTPLVVVGDGPERHALERLAKDKRADARFVGHVPREEALAWMRASDALWFASVREGWPTVLREAEALEVPVRFL